MFFTNVTSCVDSGGYINYMKIPYCSWPNLKPLAYIVLVRFECRKILLSPEINLPGLVKIDRGLLEMYTLCVLHLQ